MQGNNIGSARQDAILICTGLLSIKKPKVGEKFILKLSAEISIQILLFGLGIGDGHGVESGSLFVKRVGFDDLLGLEVLEESKHEFAGA